MLIYIYMLIHIYNICIINMYVFTHIHTEAHTHVYIYIYIHIYIGLSQPPSLPPCPPTTDAPLARPICGVADRVGQQHF